MIGKILLAILFAILALLFIALLIPVYIRVTYDGGELNAVLKYAKFTIPFRSSEKDDGEEKTEGKKKKTSQKRTQEQVQYALDTLPQIILKFLKRTGRRIWLDPLKIHILVATPDPADTAVLYGRLEGVLAALLPTAHRAVRIREQDIRLFPDFCENEMDCIADVGVGIRAGGLLAVLLLTAGSLIKWYIGFSRLASKAPAAERKNKQTTAKAESAAEQP